MQMILYYIWLCMAPKKILFHFRWYLTFNCSSVNWCEVIWTKVRCVTLWFNIPKHCQSACPRNLYNVISLNQSFVFVCHKTKTNYDYILHDTCHINSCFCFLLGQNFKWKLFFPHFVVLFWHLSLYSMVLSIFSRFFVTFAYIFV